MASHVGYSKEILDNGLITEYYTGLELASDSLLLNMLQEQLLPFSSMDNSKLNNNSLQLILQH